MTTTAQNFAFLAFPTCIWLVFCPSIRKKERRKKERAKKRERERERKRKKEKERERKRKKEKERERKRKERKRKKEKEREKKEKEKRKERERKRKKEKETGWEYMRKIWRRDRDRLTIEHGRSNEPGCGSNWKKLQKKENLRSFFRNRLEYWKSKFNRVFRDLWIDYR
jgi:flagellar biosynthesis GTPase FlhF